MLQNHDRRPIARRGSNVRLHRSRERVIPRGRPCCRTSSSHNVRREAQSCAKNASALMAAAANRARRLTTGLGAGPARSCWVTSIWRRRRSPGIVNRVHRKAHNVGAGNRCNCYPILLHTPARPARPGAANYLIFLPNCSWAPHVTLIGNTFGW